MKLPQVTLCTFGSAKYKDSMQKQLDYSANKVEFGAVKNIIADCGSMDEWNKAIFFDLGDYIETEFALLVHPDGGVAEPEMWRDEWLTYDFIGSPFPLPQDEFSYRDINGVIQRVGNSVALRSKKLMSLPKQLKIEWQAFHGFTHEDGAICVNYRHLFEQAGCKFAPLEEALIFGRETPVEYDGKTFVYHKNMGPNKIYPNFEI